ncbi:MAG: hypothetical protein PHS54_01210 [Clostridia bacterium]|nr:hypothetical protein [Clostridia bacterium]
MIEERERPVVIAVHPKLEFELKQRKEELESITGRPIKGGLTTYSEFAAFELEGIRKSGDEINQEILKIKDNHIKEIEINGVMMPFVPYEHYKKLFIFASILKKKKDQQQINVDLSKLKGLKKNDVKIYW